MTNTDILPRVLYCTHRVPYPPDKGDRIRNYHVLRQLAKVSRVWLAGLADESTTPEQRTALEQLCERVEILPVSKLLRWPRALLSLACGRSITEGAFREPALAGLLKRWAREAGFAAALVSASSLIPYLRLKELRKLPSFVDLVDVDSQKWFDFAAATSWPKRALYKVEGHRVRKLEKSLPSWAAAITLVSPHESAIYDGFTHPGAATTATNGVDLDYFHPQPNVAQKKACVFVGAMDYFPNVDAVIWFAKEMWPGIRQKHPDAEFRIVGRKPTAEVQALAKVPGVVVTGGVPDVRSYVAEAMLAVAPIRVARGLQNKVLEALAMGKATIAAPAAIAALKVEVGRHLLSPQTPDEWVTTVCQLFEDAPRRASLGIAAREFAEQNHNWETCLKPMVGKLLVSSECGIRSAE